MNERAKVREWATGPDPEHGDGRYWKRFEQETDVGTAEATVLEYLHRNEVRDGRDVRWYWLWAVYRLRMLDRPGGDLVPGLLPQTMEWRSDLDAWTVNGREFPYEPHGMRDALRAALVAMNRSA